MSLSDYYDQDIVIYARTTSTGWASESGFSTAGTSAAAAVNLASEHERVAGGRETAFVTHKMFMSDTVTLTEGYRVAWSGKNLNVIKVKDTLQKGHHKLVLLSEPE